MFSLGAIQALARYGWLKKVDYLSTVSGGGYIGSSLTWLLHRVWRYDAKDVAFDTTEEDFPYGTHRRSSAHKGGEKNKMSLLRYLRQHRDYLFPGKGIGPASLFAVVLRGMLLNFLIYLPLLAILMAGWRFVEMRGFPDAAVMLRGSLTASIILPPYTNMGFVLATLLVGLFVLSAPVYGLGTFVTSKLHRGRSPYLLRRCYEISMRYLWLLVALLALLGTLPVVREWLSEWVARLVSGGLTVSGILIGIRSFVRSARKNVGKIPLEVLAGVGSFLLIYGVLLLSHFLSDLFLKHPLSLIPSVGIVCILLGWLANINCISVHRYYRDRLMESFMPDVDQALANRTGPAYSADREPLHNMCRYPDARGPYHIISTNVVLVDSEITKYRARGGDCFILSPLYCGSRATGWRQTADFVNGRIALSTAMAISGAAVNPDTGAGGEGPTRNPMLSILMTLLNIRLGYWASNPHQGGYLPERPNFFVPGLWELIRVVKRMNENSGFVLLTDGGHFENLGLYERVRRRAKVIILCDGTADPGYTFADFGNALEKIRVDFGAKIEIDLSPLTPQGKEKNPRGHRLAERGFVVGDITYDEKRHGHLIYMNTTLVENLPEDLYAYKEKHPSFPDESTADQFFDEKQFEAYRELGYQLVRRMIHSDDEKLNPIHDIIAQEPEKEGAPADAETRR